LWRLRRVDVLDERDYTAGKNDDKKGRDAVFAHGLLARECRAEQELALIT
jgi:hypothetical protein